MGEPFRTSRIVEFCDTDMAGIMHFASLFRYMESAEHELLRSWGFSLFEKVDGQVVSFPRVAASCEYHAPAHSEDILEIEVSVIHVGTKSVTYHFGFSHKGHKIATGEITCVCCRIEQGEPPKSLAIPEQIAEKLHSVMVS